MSSSTLIKTIFRNSIAEGIYKEITSRSGRYFYFLGKTLVWDNEQSPLVPVDSAAYADSTRNEIITVKEITPADVSFVVPRYEWKSGIIYDQYDDQYSTEIQGINLIAGGSEFTSVPYVYIGSTGSIEFTVSTVYSVGQLLKLELKYYIVVVAGTSGTAPPSHESGTVTNGTVSLQYVQVRDESGSGATATAVLTDGHIVSIDMTNRGIGYLAEPTVIIAGPQGTGLAPASALAVITIGPKSGKQKLEDCEFYVVTDDYNVYVCLDNNKNGISTNKPVDVDFVAISQLDGYVWKFMYNIPIGLRNKFLTTTHMPVATSIQDQFYSNGNVQIVRVDQEGSGYTGASISIIGDGYLEANPIYLDEIIIDNGGAGYTVPSVSIDPPFTNITPWVSGYVVVVGQKYSNVNDIYEIAVSGTFGVVAPVHKYGVVANGTALLKYVGTTATATITQSGGVINTITTIKNVREVTMDPTRFGSGYSSVPAITFSGGSGSGATAVAVLVAGSVSRIIVNNPGSNYIVAPTVHIGTSWAGSTLVSAGDQIAHLANLYTVTGTGTTNASVGPTHTSGSALNGTATFLHVGISAAAYSSLKCGAGYSIQPHITIGDSGTPSITATAFIHTTSSQANLIPIVESGKIASVQIDDGGVGYTFADLTISGDGTGAEISAQLSVGDANTLQSNIELLAVDGSINNIPVVSGGYGYTVATVTISGDGTGAEATVSIHDGTIFKVTITHPGQGYRWATADISGDGVGSKLRVIITPYGGHGREALNNLFARTLMFYSNISADRNQGFAVNNDYRQLGILKNPRYYGNTYSLTVNSASACWVVSSDTTISSTTYPIDSLIYLNYGLPNESRFRIVSNAGTAILLQSLDNGIIVLSSTLRNGAGNSFVATTVTPPTMDKYSGDMLYIDNKEAFTPTADQLISIRTVLKF